MTYFPILTSGLAWACPLWSSGSRTAWTSWWSPGSWSTSWWSSLCPPPLGRSSSGPGARLCRIWEGWNSHMISQQSSYSLFKCSRCCTETLLLLTSCVSVLHLDPPLMTAHEVWRSVKSEDTCPRVHCTRCPPSPHDHFLVASWFPVIIDGIKVKIKICHKRTIIIVFFLNTYARC